jgi:AcrR family transcriptional regulator
MSKSQATPPPPAGTAAGQDRRSKRRQATRQKLLDAARTLFAGQGVDNTRINEITEGADVGFGSFYNHFEDKDAIVEAVLAEAVASQGAGINAAAENLDDPAEVIAVAHRYFVRLARRDPDWAWLLIRLDASHDIVLNALGPFASRDLERGVEAGRLSVADESIALYASGGALLAVMRAVLDGRAPEDADVKHAEGLLRMLGLSAADAAEVAGRPFPLPGGAFSAGDRENG